jgi:hypothetical protein
VKDNRDVRVQEVIEQEGGNFTHVAMWYIIAMQEHKMLRVSKATGKLEKRDNITRLAYKLHQAIYGKDLTA